MHRVLSLDNYSPSRINTLSNADHFVGMNSTVPSSQANRVGIQHPRQSLSYPRRRAQTACAENQKLRQMRLNRNKTLAPKFRATINATINGSHSKTMMFNQSEVAFAEEGARMVTSG